MDTGRDRSQSLSSALECQVSRSNIRKSYRFVQYHVGYDITRARRFTLHDHRAASHLRRIESRFEDTWHWLGARVPSLLRRYPSTKMAKHIPITILRREIRRRAGQYTTSIVEPTFMRNMSSPLVSVAPMILSGCSPRSKPRGFESSSSSTT